MAMRIITVHSCASEETGPRAEWNRRMANTERDNMKLVAEPDTEIVMRFPKWGLRDTLDGFFHPLTNRLNDRNVFHQIVAAEKEGFDAAITACFYDPILRELRTAVDIPVVGIAEASMHLAAQIGGRFGVVAISPEGLYDYEANIDKCGLRQRSVGVRSMRETATGWLANTLEDIPRSLEKSIEEFSATARALIALGADIIISGCGLLAPSLRMAGKFKGFEKKYPNGFNYVDGVPIMDVYGASIKLAETLVRFKRAGSPWISRVAYYGKVSPAALECGRDTVKDVYGGWWDC